LQLHRHHLRDRESLPQEDSHTDTTVGGMGRQSMALVQMDAFASIRPMFQQQAPEQDRRLNCRPARDEGAVHPAY
jgi:hypothetical protein